METAKKLVEYLIAHNMSIATAESCTGGMVSQLITSISGASAIFGYGLCTYANEAKMKLLGVKRKTLDEYGAVSAQTAEEMALGLKALSGADIAVSVTGIAGPLGGTPEKPVGTVWLGCAAGSKVTSIFLSHDATMNRRQIRESSAERALLFALENAQELYKGGKT